MIKIDNVKFSEPQRSGTPPRTWFFCDVEFSIGSEHFYLAKVSSGNTMADAKKVVVKYLADHIFAESDAMDAMKK